MRNTETRILNKLNGPRVTEGDYTAILNKTKKGQTPQRARAIATATEQESTAFFTLHGDWVTRNRRTKQWLQDYTRTSAFIQRAARNWVVPFTEPLQTDQNRNYKICVHELDNIFQHYQTEINDWRIVYRMWSYKPDGIACPYDNAINIRVGDYLQQKGFMSTSQHRRFLIEGINNAPADTKYVKCAVIGRGGLNVACASIYNNVQAYRVFLQRKKINRIFQSALSGQAEILYPRNTIVCVKKHERVGIHHHLVVSIEGVQGLGVKDMYALT